MTERRCHETIYNIQHGKQLIGINNFRYPGPLFRLDICPQSCRKWIYHLEYKLTQHTNFAGPLLPQLPSQATPWSYRHNSRKGSADLRSPQSVQTFPRSLEPRERSSEKFDVWWNMLNMKATNAMQIPCLPTVTDPKFINSKQVKETICAQPSNDTQLYNDGIFMHLPVLVGCSCYHPMSLFQDPNPCPAFGCRKFPKRGLWFRSCWKLHGFPWICDPDPSRDTSLLDPPCR